jgi:transcriptional regulator with XRE-family HTH domain
MIGNNGHLARLVCRLRQQRAWSRSDLANRVGIVRPPKARRWLELLEDEGKLRHEPLVRRMLELLEADPADIRAAVEADEREFHEAFRRFMRSRERPALYPDLGSLRHCVLWRQTFPREITTHAAMEEYACRWARENDIGVLVKFSRRHYTRIDRSGRVTRRGEANLDYWDPRGYPLHEGRDWTAPRFRWDTGKDASVGT